MRDSRCAHETTTRFNWIVSCDMAGTKLNASGGADVAWQSYKTAWRRKEWDVARERLATYLKLCCKAEGGQPSPMISADCDQYGLLRPSLAFLLPGDGWLLSHHPPGLLEAIEHFLHSDSLAADYYLAATEVLAKLAGRWENYLEIQKSAVAMIVLETFDKLCHKVQREPADPSPLSALRHCVCFLHCILDPRRHWQQSFMRLRSLSDVGLVSVEAAPPNFVGVFVQWFSQHWAVAETHSDLHEALQLDIIHMLGAALLSCKDNVCVAANQDVCLLLLTLLDPREQCTSVQALAVKVFVRLVHSLHNTVPAEEQTTVDCGVMLVGFLNILSPRYHEDHPIAPCMRLVVLMLDAIPSLMRPPGNAPAIKQLFVAVGCFEKIFEVLNTIKPQVEEGSSESSVLVCAMFRAFRAVMERNAAAREGFEARVGHHNLAHAVSAITPPTTDVLQQALEMVVEDSYKFAECLHSIHNTAAVAMLVRWMPSLPPPLQSWLADRLYDLCSSGAHNKQRCCSAQLLCVVVETLVSSQHDGRQFSEEVEDHLVSLVEVLGAHSIRASELKCIVGALIPTKSGMLPTYYYRLMKSLSVMAHGTEGEAPLYYFDLRATGSSISIPELKHFPSGSSFSFYTWVCLDFPQLHGKATYSDADGFSSFSSETKRRILYSFYTAAGTGFEAFFTTDLSLVVATATRKEFITTSLKGLQPTPHSWHSVCVVYRIPRKPWGKCELSVYIDGSQMRSAAVKAPNFSDNFTSCCIGLAPGRGGGRVHGSLANPSLDLDITLDEGCSSCPISDCDAEWGQATNLRGLISSLCIFTEDLSPSSIQLLHDKGPNDLALFQPKSPETRDLASKLYIYYHAKACKNNACVDLSPTHISDQSLYGRLSGQHYVTWDVKAMLNSLGGVELLFPILEQVDLPLTARLGGEVGGRDEPPTEEQTHKAANCWLFTEREPVGTFLKLVMAMLHGSPSNQQAFFLSEGPATIGALLQRISPAKITITAFSVLQELVETFSNVPEQRCDVFRYLLFDFRIWSRTCCDVRCAHVEFLSAVIHKSLPDCRREFGVQYLLDVVRVFYSHSQSADSSMAALTTEQLQHIRSSLLKNIQEYVRKDIHWEELEAVVSFLVGTRDSTLQEEVLRLLLNLLTSCPSQYAVGDLLWDKGLPLLVLIQAQSMSVRLLTIKIMSQLCVQHSYNEFGPIYTALHNGSLAAVVAQMTQHELSSSVILALLELCVSKDKTNYTDYISNLHVYMSVLQLLRCAPLMVRHTICQQVISMLHLTPHHVVDIATSPGWESLFLWLLTPFDPVVPALSPSTAHNRPSLKAYLAQARENAASRTFLGAGEEEEEEGEEEGGRPHRKRTAAFNIDERSRESKTLSPTHLASGLVKRRSLTYSSSWLNAEQEESNEVSMTVNSVTETIGYILWHSVDYDTGNPPWKVWGRFFAALDTFASFHTLTLPAHAVKQRLFLLLINAVTLDSKRLSINRAALLDVILQLSQLFEDFTLCSYPRLEASMEEEGELDSLLLKLAQHFSPEVDLRHCSLELLERYMEMLTSAKLVGGVVAQPSGLELEVLQSAVRLLLGCLANPERMVYEAGSTHLQLVVKNLPKSDACFVLSCAWRLLAEEQGVKEGEGGGEGGGEEEEGEGRRRRAVAAVMRAVLLHHSELSCSLPSLPDLSSRSSTTEEEEEEEEELHRYCSTGEWREFTEDTLKAKEVQYHGTVLMPWLQTLARQRAGCSQSAQRSEEQRREIIIDNQKNYHDGILSKFFDQQELEERRQVSVASQQCNELSATLLRWRNTRRFFTGERGAWSSPHRERESYLWKLDRAENFSRMRVKLTRNYNYDTHAQASRLRDMGHVQPVATQPADTSVLAKVSRRTSTFSFLEEDDLEPGTGGADPAGLEGATTAEDVSVKEKIVRAESCDLVSLMERTHGRLEVTSRNLYFFSDQQDKKDTQTWYGTDFKVPLDHLRVIHSRRYNMARTALEIFLVDQTNYFLNFPSKKIVKKVYDAIVALHPANLNRIGLHKPSRLLQTSGLTQKWIRRDMTNFDYLMTLNTISGRTYNDLNQYPVFPWVLTDYTSPELDLKNLAVFRDLSKPIGIQNERLVDHVVTRYEEFEDPTIGKFHYGSHYSNAAGVMHYLIRVEPFTTLHIELQSGRFDYADRQFFSIPSSWSTIYTTGSDVKELIPEFFYLPEMLKNHNDFDLGRLQTGQVLNDVVLPAWASSPEDFIYKHRQALESDYVSAHLHEWIDLIFGCKQTGPEAVKALNLFNFYTYEENVNLESIQDPKERRQIEAIINNFGQTPTQLFTEPHPQRLTQEAAQKSHSKGFTFIGRRSLLHLFDHLSTLKAHFVEISSSGHAAVVFVATPSIQTRALLVSGNPEQLITVTSTGVLNVHGWLPFSSSKNKHFYFQFDPNAHFDPSHWLYMGGPFSQDIAVSSHLFVVSPNNKLLVSGGHWDNSFRVYSIERSKLIARIAHHNDIVTCLALDKDGSGEHLITGSRDTTCAIWKFGASEVFAHPLVTLYGHDSEVLCVAISTELDIAASGAKDGTCLVHTVRQGRYIHTLTPQQGCRSCEIRHLAISVQGFILLYTEDASSRFKTVHTRAPCLHLYSINGNLIMQKELAECVNAVAIVDRYLITGNVRGFLTFRDLFSLQQHNSLNLSEPIRCVSVVLDHLTKACTQILVGLETGRLIIVSPKELP